MGKSALSSSSPRAEEQGRGGTPAAALGRWPGARGRPGPFRRRGPAGVGAAAMVAADEL